MNFDRVPGETFAWIHSQVSVADANFFGVSFLQTILCDYIIESNNIFAGL